MRASITRDLENRLVSILAPHDGHTYTAAALRVQRGEEVLLELARGFLNPERDRTPVDLDSPFDLASLTKLFTAAAVLRLTASGRLRLDDPVDAHLAGFVGPGKTRVTVRHLLTHTSGLPPLVRLFGPGAPPGDPWDVILGCPLDRSPGEAVVYSDVGFMLLGLLVEAVAECGLKEAMRTLVLDPLQLESAGYGPAAGAPATEQDPWRGRRLQGEVHDENAAALGGVSGHAGLFAAASDVARFSRALASVEPFLPCELSAEARREQAATGDERRGLGWKLRSPAPEAAERPFSPQSFGHYGFTGTAVWNDPQRDLTVVLLTNRVYFGRDAESTQRLRREVFAAVTEAVDSCA